MGHGNSTDASDPNPVPDQDSGPLLLEKACWLDANWMFISAVILPISLIYIFATERISIKNRLFLGWLTVPFYCWHQWEEHAWDLCGWRYAFVPNFNHGVGALLFKECQTLGHLTCPLEPRLGSYINIPLVWMGFPVTMVLAKIWGGPFEFAGHMNWGMCFMNAMGGHLLPWILTGSYNPGAVQSIFMALAATAIMSSGGPKFFAVCVLNGALFHAICFGLGMNLILKANAPQEIEVVLCFLLSTVVPLQLARLAAPTKSAWYELDEDADDDEECESDQTE
mmetsp:Transcript_59935/g.128633  ORF Transcript_59935/g.128633 Transcript_59935/m.128633 type:complete len:281 (+) Transcript_59935:75-917(+)